MTEKQKSYRVEQIMDALKGIIIKSPDPDNLDDVILLTPEEITEVVRGLKIHNPKMAKLIQNLRRQFPRDLKFPIRHALIIMAYAIAKGKNVNGKLRRL